MPLAHLENAKIVKISQRRELAELFGLETRNKYEIQDENGVVIGFAAEQGKSLLAHFARHFFGHWRRFDIFVFDNERRQVLRSTHPFRFFFQRMEIFDSQDKQVGSVQQRFALFHKRFDLEDDRGNVLMEVKSPIWKFWTFPVTKNGREVAFIRKKWSGAIHELMFDKDNFVVEFPTPLALRERTLLLVAALFVDLQYFEKKANRE